MNLIIIESVLQNQIHTESSHIRAIKQME